MGKSSGAFAPITNHRELLSWFRFRGGARGQSWWSQPKMAADTGLRLRTLQRWIAQLATDGYLEVVRCGRTSNLYNLLARPEDKPVDCGGTNGGTNAPYLLNETKPRKEEPRRKPPQPEILQEPPIYVRNEYGYQHLNPAWQEWRDREIRIGRARNPAAYRRAIMEQTG